MPMSLPHTGGESGETQAPALHSPDAPFSPTIPRRWGIKLLLVAIVALVYANSLLGAFVLDDLRAIMENPTIRSLSAPGRILATFPKSTANGRPILNFSLAVNYALGGLDPKGYHLLNVGIHALAALVLFGIVRRTLRLHRIDSGLASRADGMAFAVALLWAIHPLQTASVTYVIQRAESLMGLFFLLTLYALLRGSTSTTRAGSRRAWFAVAVASCALGMGTKEAMVTAPLLVVLYNRIFLSTKWSEVFVRRGWLHVFLASTWVILALLVARSPDRGGTAGFNLPFSWLQYLATEFGVILHYLRLIVWPSPLVLDYGWPVARGIGDAIVPAVAVGALVALTVWGIVRRPALAFLGVWFFAILAPTSSIFPIVDPIFEHRIYLSLAGVVCLTVLGVERLLAWIERIRRSRDTRLGRTVRPIALAAVALVLGLLTIERNRDFASEISIWGDTIHKRPMNARAYDFLGSALGRQGIYSEAVDNHSEAIRLRPDWHNAYYNRGNTYLRAEMYKEAIADYSIYLRSKNDANAYNNRAIAYLAIGAYDKAWADVNSCRQLGLEPHPDLLGPLRQASGRSR